MKGLFLATGLVFVGCGTFASETPANMLDREDAPSTTSPTAGNEDDSLFDNDAQPECCVKAGGAPFVGPSWFQVAAPNAIGDCPQGAIAGIEAFAELQSDPHVCGACSCSPATCALPEGIHTNAASCPGDGSMAVPLGPAAGWEGVCSEEGALPADLQCGGEPCAQSVSIPSLPIAPCKASSAAVPPPPAPAWGRMTRECRFEPLSPEACAPGETCVPQPAPDGFALCLHAEGEQPTCPAEYPVRELFFSGMEDHRGCDLCLCSPQEGADCMATVSVFSDSQCGVLAGAVVVTHEEAACVDVIDGTALASMEASLVLDSPGSCAPSGGAPFGSVLPSDPITLCCQGAPLPPG